MLLVSVMSPVQVTPPKPWTEGNGRCAFLLTSHQAPPRRPIPAVATATAALTTKQPHIYTSIPAVSDNISAVTEH